MEENRKPWEHSIKMELDREENLDGTVDVMGMKAVCTCGDFSFSFAEGVDPGEMLDRTQPHIESHPLPPLSIATLGDESLVLVMAVPGPEGPVHMSIGVSREIFEDSHRLSEYIGTIGSPLHFQISEQREKIRQSMKDIGFGSIQMPFGASGLDRALEMLREQGLESIGPIRIDVPEPQVAVDDTVYPTIGKKPEGWPGFQAATGETEQEEREGKEKS